MASRRASGNLTERALQLIAVAVLATTILASPAAAQRAPIPSVPRLTTLPPSIGPAGPPAAPAATGPGPTTPRPTGASGGAPTFTPPSPSAGARTVPTTNAWVTPTHNLAPRVPRISGGAPESHFSMRSNPNCNSYKSFEGFGGRPCTQKPRRTIASGGGGDSRPPRGATKKAAPKASAGAIASRDFVPNEIIIEVDGTVTEAQAIALAQRHRLTRVESQNFPLIGATMFRWRIPDRRSIDTVARRLLADGSVRSVQRNFRFTLQQSETARNDPGQYAIGKLHLAEAHAVSKGEEVRIAVIDSGVDVTHPELAGAIVGTYDALRSTEGPHSHGTAIAGAIAAHARLLGSAPSARLLAIRAFGATSKGAESTSFVVLKSLNYAVEHGAQIINMSFAGPKDPLLERGLGAAARRGIVLIAAAGNAGPKSPPLFPAADRNVIAVSAVDVADRLFPAANRGDHVALAAPGVDLLLPSPEEKYQVASGTSFAAAYVSGVAALIIERNPGVSPDVVRRILTETACDVGPEGRDDAFGAGLANALAAVQAARPVTAGAASRSHEEPASNR